MGAVRVLGVPDGRLPVHDLKQITLVHFQQGLTSFMIWIFRSEKLRSVATMEDKAFHRLRKRQKTERGCLFIPGRCVSASPSSRTESEHKASLCSDYESSIRAKKLLWVPRSKSIEPLPANSYGAALQRIPLEVRRLCDDEPKAWSWCVHWATDPQDLTPHFARRSERRVGPKAKTV